jgi:hypothetical protein
MQTKRMQRDPNLAGAADQRDNCHPAAQHDAATPGVKLSHGSIENFAALHE